VSAPSILTAVSCASAGKVAKAKLNAAPMPHAVRVVALLMLSPLMR
jgi:hypothetical protein